MIKRTFLLVGLALISTISSFAQESTSILPIEYFNGDDNNTINVYFPHFEQDKYADILNSETCAIFNEYNLNKDSITVSGEESLISMLEANGQKLSEIGLSKSIEAIPYVHVSTWSIFINKYITSLYIDQYAEMGAVLPIVRSHAVNISHTTDELFDPASLILDTVAFMDIAADIYRKDARIGEDDSRASTGLKYDLSELPVAKVMAFTKKGLMLYYNRGEIASLSTPSISILVPYGKMQRLLPEDFFDGIYNLTCGKNQAEKVVRQIAKKNGKYAHKQSHKIHFRQY